MTRQRVLEMTAPVSDFCPLAAEALPWIGHQQVRNRRNPGDIRPSAQALVVEVQDPPELPLDSREELHLKVADTASIAYRKLLRGL